MIIITIFIININLSIFFFHKDILLIEKKKNRLKNEMILNKIEN